MDATRRPTRQLGESYVWATGGAVTLTILMVGLLVAVVMVKGLGFFWPQDLVLARLADGSRALGEIHGREETVEGELASLQLKVGNRDLYGQDFRWIPAGEIEEITHPPDAVMLERLEHGNFYGFLQGLRLPGLEVPAEGTAWERFRAALARVREHREALGDERAALARINRRMDAVRGEIEELRYEGAEANATRIRRLEARRDQLQQRFERRNRAVLERVEALRRNVALFSEANGREHTVALLDVVRAARPNRMSVWAKMAFYASRLGELLTGEPREANTEGGLYPAIFGTVLMVMLMSVFALPLGVVAAIYLREYAREGLLVRLVRIAVYNLAGVPSIVFGVFGLGFFVYGVGGLIDEVFFPERLPTPTFGTGGILWASLTLALLTVPVVIVATEEGLTAIPRGLREASLALGATRFQTLVRVVLPMAVPGIITGFILSMARAAGEVAPLMITGVVKLAPNLPVDGVFPYVHLERKFMHLGFHIYDVGFQSPNVEAAKPMVYITTLLLVGIVIVLSLTSIYLRNRLRRRFQTSTF